MKDRLVGIGVGIALCTVVAGASSWAAQKHMQNALEKAGVTYSLYPRRAGSWPGVMFTGAPLKMAAGHYGLGRGGGAHAPNEWLLIDSSDPKVAGYEQQAVAFADYLYEVARAAR